MVATVKFFYISHIKAYTKYFGILFRVRVWTHWYVYIYIDINDGPCEPPLQILLLPEAPDTGYTAPSIVQLCSDLSWFVHHDLIGLLQFHPSRHVKVSVAPDSFHLLLRCVSRSQQPTTSIDIRLKRNNEQKILDWLPVVGAFCSRSLCWQSMALP